MSGAESKTSIVIRAFEAADLTALAQLHAACFSEAWDGEALAVLLAMPGAFSLLAVEAASAGEGPDPSGFVMARAVADEAEIISLGVRPDRRQHGLGRRLLAAAMAEVAARGAAQLFLEVAADNHAARALYLGAGFVPVAERSNYYHRPGADVSALVLTRSLAGAGNPENNRGSQIKRES